MTAAELIAALDLPAEARVDLRVPKKALLEQGEFSPADQRAIGDGVEELVWLAALKPTTIGVPAFRDAEREYLEIAVLRLVLRPGAKGARLAELVHRAVPYPVVLAAEQGGEATFSLARKRRSQADRNKTVLDGEMVAAETAGPDDEGVAAAFRAALSLRRQPRATIFAVYEGWTNAALALAAARETGVYELAPSAERVAARCKALRECRRLDAEIAALRAAAERETQMTRRVEINLELQRAQAARAAARARL